MGTLKGNSLTDDCICIVTGANGGIGQAAALEFARRGVTVVMVCRDRAKGEQAKQVVMQQSRDSRVDLMIADLSRQASIRQFVTDFKQAYPRLDALVNNAGVYKATYTPTVDGLETMFATNHLGYFLITNLLLDSLKASEAARVVNITAPSTTELNFDDLQGKQTFSALNAFGASKMANLLFTFALAKRLEGTHITVNAVHPGLVRSGIMREANPIIRLLTWIMSRSPEQAAKSIVDVSLGAEYAGKTGRFYTNGKEIQPPKSALNAATQEQLWDVSEQLTHLIATPA